MNATASRTFRPENRLTRLGLLTEPAGYVDGQNLYEYVGSNPVKRLDPSGLAMTDAEAKDWLTKNKDQFKSAASGDCEAALAAMAAIYVELRRQGAIGKMWEVLNGPGGYIQNGTTPGATLGPSFGPGQIKMETAEWTVLNDKYGIFLNDFQGKASGQEFRAKVADLVMNDPAKVATSMIRSMMDQWSDARAANPSIPDISNNPGILATLYNLGPNARQPHPTPGLGGTPNVLGNGLNFGEEARNFADSQWAKDFLKECGCAPGEKSKLPQKQPPLTMPPNSPPAEPSIFDWLAILLTPTASRLLGGK